jgi:hypothetical protein
VAFEFPPDTFQDKQVALAKKRGHRLGAAWPTSIRRIASAASARVRLRARDGPRPMAWMNGARDASGPGAGGVMWGRAPIRGTSQPAPGPSRGRGHVR